jgi:hypothetical protein
MKFPGHYTVTPDDSYTDALVTPQASPDDFTRAQDAALALSREVPGSVGVWYEPEPDDGTMFRVGHAQAGAWHWVRESDC